MKKSILAAAFAVSFAMVACDSSSSADSSEITPQSSENGTVLSSDANAVLLSSDANTSSLSSAAEVLSSAGDAGNTVSSSSQGGEILTGNSSSSVVTDPNAVLTSEQMAMLKVLEDKLGEADSNFVIENSCQTGAVKKVTVWGQEVTFTCMFEDWIPTAGLDKVYAQIPDEDLQPELERLGITRDDLMAVITMLSNLDPNKNSLDVICEGEPDGDYWKLVGTGVFNGLTATIDGNLTFDGNNFIMNRNISMDVGSESACKGMLAAEEDGEDEDDEGDELYGTVISSVTKCDGSKLVLVEQTRRENVTSAERAVVYDDMIGQCKAYLAGQITFEELMSN